MEMMSNAIVSIAAMLVTLGILVTFHEFGHFWVARRCGVKVERFSIGIGKPILRWRGKPERGFEHEVPTEYVIGLLPLGGYVKMLGEQDGFGENTGREMPGVSRNRPEDPATDPRLLARAFNQKSLLQRTAIVAAGPIANFLLAIALYWVMFWTGISGLAPVIGHVEPGSPAALAGLAANDEIMAVDGETTATWQEVNLKLLDRLGESGNLVLTVKSEDSSLQQQVMIPLQRWLAGEDEPDLMGTLGIVPWHQYIAPALDQVLPDGRAAAAGLRTGDLIVSANGIDLDTWSDWLDVIRANPESEIAVGLQRDGLPLELSLRPAVRMGEDGAPELDAAGNTQGYIGATVILPQMPQWMNRSLRYSLIEAIPKAVRETWDNSKFVLVSIKKMLAGLISVKNISGPITIAQVAGQTASYGFEYYIGFLAVLSISLGVLNLLPIPVLDGGHLFYYGIEAVIRRPLPRRIQELGMQVGIIVISCLMFLALYNDVNRLF
jgi:regulator of sigma E protease